MTTERWQLVKEVLNGALHVGGKNVRHFWDVRARRTPLSESKLTPFLPLLPMLWSNSSNPRRRIGCNWRKVLGSDHMKSTVWSVRAEWAKSTELAIRGWGESSLSRSTLSP